MAACSQKCVQEHINRFLPPARYREHIDKVEVVNVAPFSYPKSDMDGGSVRLAQGVGGQIAVFTNAMNAEDDVELLASTRECTRNGSPEKKEGFYQYSAAWDSKHRVTLAEGKTARVLFEMQEMQDERSP